MDKGCYKTGSRVKKQGSRRALLFVSARTTKPYKPFHLMSSSLLCREGEAEGEVKGTER